MKVTRGRIASVLPDFLMGFGANAAAVDHSLLKLFVKGGAAEVGAGDIGQLEVARRLVWWDVHVETTKGRRVVSGLSRRDADQLVLAVEQAKSRWWQAWAVDNAASVEEAARGLELISSPPRYMSRNVFSKVYDQLRDAYARFPHRWETADIGRVPESAAVFSKLAALRDLIRDPEGHRQRANRTFVERELKDGKALFDSVAASPLTEEQRRAVVIDEDRNLVVAAAGSGKTSVIVAKAAWLISRTFRRPNEMLMLAFASDARDEIKKRFSGISSLGAASEIEVNTFHGHGLSIVKAVEGRAPSVSRVAEDPKALTDLLKKIMKSLVEDPARRDLVVTWFSSFFAPYRSTMEFENEGQYWAYIRENEIRSLQGEKLKSLEECEIANFLYLNSIPYEYERRYEHDTATAQKRQYQPDFFLPEHGIYIEHFALNAAGNTPPFIDRESYVAGIEWKRKLHAEHQTILVETFSYEKSAGVLCVNLAQKLSAHGVQFTLLPAEQVFSILEEQGRIDPFTRLVATFLNHFKSGRHTIEDLRTSIPLNADRSRAEAFLNLFDHIVRMYEGYLTREKEIDFTDMIIRATDYLETGRYRSPFGYILVDEFQDISVGRARFLKALLNSHDGSQLFSVGDDWQSIYRFAGSDISIMRQFSEQFGEAARTDLSITFRCVDQIADNAAKFILKNPLQLRKELSAVSTADKLCIHIGTVGGNDDNVLLDEALARISAALPEGNRTVSVLLLGRYKHLRPDNLDDLKRRYPRLRMSYMTIHRSKGSEADYVIVLGMTSGRYGFPSEIVDDPVLDLVLAQAEGHPNAEERRLFYVAVTRARKEVYLLASRTGASSFVEELLSDGYRVTTFGGLAAQTRSCPRCIEGQLLARKSGDRTFYGCSNFPYCDHTEPACPRCGVGLLLRGAGGFNCSSCGHEVAECPRCHSWLAPRTGKYGDFLGCVSFPACDYTRDLP